MSQYTLQLTSTVLQQVKKFKCLGVVFTNDGSQSKEIGTQIGKANTIFRSFFIPWLKTQEL